MPEIHIYTEAEVERELALKRLYSVNGNSNLYPFEVDAL